MYKRTNYQIVKERIEEPRHHIQVFLGPRQVGKTTMALALADELNVAVHYPRFGS